MTARVLQFLNTHKISLVLGAVIVYLLLRQSGGGISPLYNSRSSVSYDMAQDLGGVAMAPAMEKSIAPAPDDYAPSESSDRLVVTQSSLSLQVKDVRNTLDAIQAKAEELGGFLVNSNLNTPEGASSGNTTVRVPSDQLDQALEAFRGLAVKVVSESINGTDVTDQYEDLDARLKVLETTQTKFLTIQDQAVEIADLLEVQRELVSLQSQIDNIKGRQKYLATTAKLSVIYVSVSTDELALPYSPDGVWRPAVVFKEAVRSLIGNLRSLGNALIWLAVYSPILLVIFIAYRLLKRLKKPTPQT